MEELPPMAEDVDPHLPHRGLEPIHDFAAEEVCAMARFALEAGLCLPATTTRVLAAIAADRTASPAIGPVDFGDLVLAHAELSVLVAPLTPRTVLLMHHERERSPLLASFGPLPIMRRMTFLAAAALVGLLGTSLSDQINAANMQRDLIENSGMPLFIVEIFLVCAALLGTTFSNLFQLSRALDDGSYDDRQDAIYWTNIVVGVMSGIILSQFVFHVMQAEEGRHAAGEGGSPFLRQPLLALIGGFSGSLVHKTLSRIILAIEFFFDGSPFSGANELQSRRQTKACARSCPCDPT